MYNSEANRRTLYEQQGGRCTGCLQPLPYRNLTVDHIQPQSRGGGHGIGNLQLLCGACNSKKGAGTHEELVSRLVTDGVVRVTRSWLTRRRGYAPVRGGEMGPVAAVVVFALPYVVDGAVRATKVVYENRAGIRAEAEKQAGRVPKVRLPKLRRRGRVKAGVLSADDAERWWWWTASGR